MNMPDAAQHPVGDGRSESVTMPKATAAPMIVALGATLLAAGCVTSWVLSGLGGALLLGALVVWVAQLLPGRGEHELAWVASEQRARPVAQARVGVEPRPPRLILRMQVPERVHPYSSGVRGGIVGGAAMAIIALGYGVASGRGIWYPVNLLAAMLLPSLATASDAELEQFDALALVLGLFIHGVVSAGAGLCYGVLLPTLPRWPALWGGIVAPLLWTGGIYGFMGVLNPVMNARVDWPWFIASQVVYGLVAGFVVHRSAKGSVGAKRPGQGRGRGGP